MENKFYAIIVAGGSGMRMGADIPKQFIEICGKAILQRSIEKFISAYPFIKIITVLPKEHIDYWEKYCLKASFSYPQMIVEGGITRFHSVKNAISKVPDGAVVAVHDGVRPFASEALIRKLFDSMTESRAVIPVVPVTDTLKVLRKEKGVLRPVVGASIDRSITYCAQTPQVFRSEDLKDAYTLPFDISFTDDASVVERKGIPITYVEGEKNNIKITTPQDLDFAEYLSLRYPVTQI